MYPPLSAGMDGANQFDGSRWSGSNNRKRGAAVAVERPATWTLPLRNSPRPVRVMLAGAFFECCA